MNSPLPRLWWNSIACVVLLSGTWSFGAEEKPVAPIKVSENAKLQSEFMKTHREWAKRVLIAPLAERGKGQPWESAAIAFAEKACDDLTTKYQDDPLREIDAEAQKVLSAGCKDPLVNYLAARIAYRLRRKGPTVSRIYDKVISEVEKVKAIPRALLCFAGRDLASTNPMMTKGNPRYSEQIVRWTREALEDGSYKPEDDAVFVRHQIDEQWRLNNAPNAVLENLNKVYSASKMPEWAQRTALGSNEIRLAWNARGGGYADSVTEEGWKGFSEHLGKARKELVGAWKLRPERPEAAARMIEVVLGQGSEDDNVRNWFDRAIAAQFDYPPAYSGILRAYLPRWGGSLELMIEFGRACRDTRRYDTSVPLVFLEAVHDVVNEVDDRRALYEHVPGLAREVAELGEALAREPTRAAEKKNWLSYGCVQAWVGREYEIASRLFKEIGGRLTSASERDVPVYGVTPQQFALDLELHASKAGADFDHGEKLFDEDNVEAAREAFVSAEKIAPESTKPLVRSRIDVIDFERQLARGEWVKVTPKPGLFEWKARGGAWEATEDGTIVSRGSTYRGVLLFRGRVGPDYELRGEFEAESDADSDRRFGLVTGSREPAADGVEFSTYQVAGGASALVAPLKGGLPNRPKQTPFTFKPKNHFLLRVEDGRTTYDVNGETLFPSAEAPPQIAQFEASHFGFTGAIVRSGNVTRVRNIEVRRLPKRL